MAAPKDYYDVLDVSRTATDDEIRAGFRKLARKFHPDVCKEEDAEKRFAEVQEAYEVLSDKEKRESYDRFGHPGSGGTGGTPTGGGWNYGSADGQQVDPSAFQDIFEEMFSGGGGGGGSPFSGRSAPSGAAPRRGADIAKRITVTFMTAAQGGEESIKLDDGTTVSLRIPAGIEDGSRLRIRSKGQPGPGGGPRGDIIVTVRVGGHPHFRREGLDLLFDLPITAVEAIRGTSVSVPLLTGTVDLRIPAGSSSGRKLRVPGQGIKDTSGHQGDFYAEIQIKVPESDSLSEAAQSALDTLACELPPPRDGLI